MPQGAPRAPTNLEFCSPRSPDRLTQLRLPLGRIRGRLRPLVVEFPEPLSLLDPFLLHPGIELSPGIKESFVAAMEDGPHHLHRRQLRHDHPPARRYLP